MSSPVGYKNHIDWAHSLYSTIGSPSSCRVPKSPEHQGQPEQHRINPLSHASSPITPPAQQEADPSRPGARLKLMVMDRGSRPGLAGRGGPVRVRSDGSKRLAACRRAAESVCWSEQMHVPGQTRGARLYGQGRARTGLLGSRAGPKPCREPLPTGQCRAWCEYKLIIFGGPGRGW